MNLSVEHVLLFALVVCALYYLMGSCGCKEGYTPSGKKGDCCNHDKECDSDNCSMWDKGMWDGNCGIGGVALPAGAGTKGDGHGWWGVCQ